MFNFCFIHFHDGVRSLHFPTFNYCDLRQHALFKLGCQMFDGLFYQGHDSPPPPPTLGRHIFITSYFY